MPTQKKIGRAVLFLICASAALAAMPLERSFQPKTSGCKQEYPGAVQSTCFVPYVLNAEHVTAYLEFSFLRSAGDPVRYQITADDCVAHLQVNDRVIISRDAPLCAYPQGRVFDLTDIVAVGENRVRLLLRNAGGLGQFLIRSDPSAPEVLSAKLEFLGGFLLAAVVAASVFSRGRRLGALEVWLIAGFAVRLAYHLATPYWSRAYDWHAHLQYVSYVLEHWSVPPASEGWEHYQPPLYYFTAALFQRFFGLAWELPVELGINVSTYSLIISGAALLAMLVICEQLTVGAPQTLRFMLMGAVALFPGVVFYCTRITNDQLQLLGGLVLLLIGIWLTNAERPGRLAVLAGVTAGLGLLSKTSAGALLPLPLIALWLNQRHPWRLRLGASVLYLALAGLILAPYLYQRHVVEGEKAFLGRETIANLNPALTLQTNLETFTVFHPLEVVKVPYNDPWNDAKRRQFFWEYLFRSAFSGELDLGREIRLSVQAMLASGLIVLFLAGVGAAYSLLKERQDRDLIVCAALALNLLALIAFRVGYPYSPCQDFRHIPTAMLPVMYFASRVPRPLQLLSVGGFALLIISSSVFYFLIFSELPPVHVV